MLNTKYLTNNINGVIKLTFQSTLKSLNVVDVINTFVFVFLLSLLVFVAMNIKCKRTEIYLITSR